MLKTTIGGLFLLGLPLLVCSAEFDIALLGLIVNDQEAGQLDIYHQGQQYYLTFNQAKEILGCTPITNGSAWIFNTPIGTASIEHDGLLIDAGEVYFPLSSFSALGVKAFFDQSDFALKVYRPWSKSCKHNGKGGVNSDTYEPIDFFPDTLGLNQININGNVERRDDRLSNNLTLEAAGSAFSGQWGMQTDVDFNRDEHSFNGEVDNFFWQKDNEHIALRFGLSKPSYMQYDVQAFSGLTLAYSNKGIARHLAATNLYHKSLLHASNEDYQNINGFGPPGGIAELRINDRPIARVRIGIDERYQFENLDVSRLDLSQNRVTVAIYEYSTNSEPLRIVDYSLGRRQSHVSAGEWQVEAGGGRIGNILAKDNVEKGDYAFLYSEYGVGNHLSIRGGMSQDDELSTELGLNIAAGAHTNLDMSWWQRADITHHEATVNYDREHIDFAYQYSVRDDNQAKNTRQQANISIKPYDGLRFSLTGYDESGPDLVDKRYFTASLNADIQTNWSLNLFRDSDGFYAGDLYGYLPASGTSVKFSADHWLEGVRLEQPIGAHTNIGGALHKRRTDSTLLPTVYLEHEFSDNLSLYSSYSRYKDKQGYEMQWRYRTYDNTYFSLVYQHNNELNEAYLRRDEWFDGINSDYIYLRFNIGLRRVPGSGMALGSGANSRLGSLIAKLPNSVEFLDNDIDKITLNINQQTVDATRLKNNSFIVNGLKPGVYDVRLDAEGLPIEYSMGTNEFARVKIERGAITKMTTNLEKQFGLAGKLTQGESQVITILQEGKLIKSVRSNEWGYFQINGLSAGKYTLVADGYRDENVELIDDFLLDVNMEPNNF